MLKLLSWLNSLPLETYTKLNTWAQYSLILLVTLTAMAAIATLFSSKRIKSLEAMNRSTLEQRLATSEQQLATAEASAKSAQEELKDLKQFKDQQNPRTLSAEQREQFLILVRGIPKGHLSIQAAADYETKEFSYAINNLLKVAGWTTDFLLMVSPGLYPPGITFVVHSQETAPPYVKPLQDAFEAIGYSAGSGTADSIPPNSLTINIGRKQGTGDGG